MSTEKITHAARIANTSCTESPQSITAKSSHKHSWSNTTLPLFFKRELGLLMRNRSDSLQPFIFFVIVVFLFPLSVKPEPELLQTMLPGCIWVSVVLATMMGLDNVFRDDFTDGSLEQFVISSRSLALIVIAKVLAHWLITGVLLSLVAALISLAIGIHSQHVMTLFVSLTLGTLSLQFVGAVGAALTVSLRRSGMLLAVIVLPLYIPILIFGAGATARSVEGAATAGPIYILSAIAVFSLSLAPLAICAALNNSID